MLRLSGYHIMIVSKYLEFFNNTNFINLEFVCKKFGGNMEKFHFNPIPLDYKTIGYYSNIETLHLWDVKNENFKNGFIINKRENKDKSLCGSMLISRLLTITKIETSNLKMLLTL
ncbi:leucine rich repeat containing protein BspA family protein, partial [Entamoeba invadens IP1]